MTLSPPELPGQGTQCILKITSILPNSWNQSLWFFLKEENSYHKQVDNRACILPCLTRVTLTKKNPYLMKPRPTITTKTTNSSQLPKHTHSFWCVSPSPLPQLSTLNTGGGEFVCIFFYNSIPQSNWYWTQEMIMWTASQVTER